MGNEEWNSDVAFDSLLRESIHLVTYEHCVI